MDDKTLDDAIPASEFAFVDRSKLDADEIVRPSESYWKGVWRRITSDKLALFCLALLAALVLLAIFAPIFSPYEYDHTDLTAGNLVPSAEHWFGTDSSGRDLWTRVWVGARVSLSVGLIGAIIPFALGMLIGSVAGWFGGWVDMVIMRIIDVGLCIPSMIYVILILVYFGGGAQAIILALAVMNWMGPARGYRGRVLQFKNREFTLAARTLGARPGRIIFRHILPNILGNIVVSLTSFVPAAIFMEASLAFIGLGINPPMTSLGQLSSDGVALYRTQFYQFAIPALVISLIIFSFYMFGNCLRDALDPQLRDEISTSALRRRRRSEKANKATDVADNANEKTSEEVAA
jgi:oligopeptide transport system permease protein